ncbi:MAG: hypothetical protein II304_10105 [Bacteroidales bacterium]|nr:hypothetical protein [Bacteroidales bacterium]
MPKKLTQEEFIKRANNVHNGKYDYSKVKYVNSSTKVCVICPIHGEFFQIGSDHLLGSGCPKCGRCKITKPIYNFGINDIREWDEDLYKCWWAMINRCYNTNNCKHFAYIDCKVCDEWKYLSNFKSWFDLHYVSGWHLDKDILIKGNRVYSPSTCCFVPAEINLTFTKRKNCRGALPIGVNVRGNKYEASIRVYDKRHYLGVYNTIEESFNAYKKAKELHIKELADKYKDRLEPRVYEALYNYQVEITD